MKKRVIFISILAVALIAAVPAVSQSVANKVLLDPTKGPVYLEFVKSGKCKKDGDVFNSGDLCDSNFERARTFDAVWIRLVNNTSWAIGLKVEKGATDANATPVMIDSTKKIDEQGRTVGLARMLANDGAEMDVVYKNESQTGCDFHKEAPKGQTCFRRETVPPVIPLPGISTSLFVAPGKSIVFPVDLAHVKEYVDIYVLYNFSWEFRGENHSPVPDYESQHRAYFSWQDLKEGLKEEKERRKPRA